MREGQIVGRVNQGAGVYGIPAPTHKTRCPQSNNPHGHSRECPCDWWALERGVQLEPREVVELPVSTYDWADDPFEAA